MRKGVEKKQPKHSKVSWRGISERVGESKEGWEGGRKEVREGGWE